MGYDKKGKGIDIRVTLSLTVSILYAQRISLVKVRILFDYLGGVAAILGVKKYSRK
ncbi:MAG: hypothetical protein ACP5IE_00810 [Infirmifilum sp.]